MHVLHIVDSYGGTEVYKNLFMALDSLGIKQTIFVPLNASNHNRIGNHLIDFQVSGSKIIYSTALTSYHKFLYQFKISTILKAITSSINIDEIDLIHAATLCVNGAVAYELNKRYRIPYICAVRNTDMELYYKYFRWRINYFFKIFKGASQVIFICPQYQKKFVQERIPFVYKKDAEKKVMIIPNGVDPLFLNDRVFCSPNLSGAIHVIFASAFVKGKGLKEIILAIAMLRDKGYNIDIKAVGRGLPFRNENKKYLQEIETIANQYDWVYLENYMSKRDLKMLFRGSHIFVMPSKPETFGLVYVEALTQNLPIVYAKGQGFDGYFSEGYIGYHVEAFNVVDIANKIELIITEYNDIVERIARIDLKEQFSWGEIAQKYYNIYKSIVGK